MELKTCCVCKVDKELDQFYKDPKGKGGKQSRCKECNKAYYKNNKPKYQEASRNKHLKNRFGIDATQYDQMEQQQGGLCFICKEEQPNRRLSVDHCHSTGLVRKLLCSHCNTGLGMFKDNVELIRKAADYIETHKGGL